MERQVIALECSMRALVSASIQVPSGHLALDVTIRTSSPVYSVFVSVHGHCVLWAMQTGGHLGGGVLSGCRTSPKGRDSVRIGISARKT